MKVPETQPIRAIDASDAATPTRAASPDRAIHDRVTVSPPPRPSPEAIAAGKQLALADRTARLEQLKAAVKSGHYVPDAQQIANQLLDQAELEARLQALLQR